MKNYIVQQKPAVTRKKKGTLNQLTSTSYTLAETQYSNPSRGYEGGQGQINTAQNIGTLMMELAYVWNGTRDQINFLLKLKYRGTNIDILSMDDREIYTEIISYLRMNGFENTVSFLRGADSRNYILWEQNIMDEGRTKIAREIIIQRTEDTGIKGVGKCKFCNSKELVFSTRQLRSGDEPATIFIRCVLCQRQWTN